MQIKTTVSYHLAVINKSPNNKFWRGYGEKEPSYAVAGTVNW